VFKRPVITRFRHVFVTTFITISITVIIFQNWWCADGDIRYKCKTKTSVRDAILKKIHRNNIYDVQDIFTRSFHEYIDNVNAYFLNTYINRLQKQVLIKTMNEAGLRAKENDN
jgi:hypothetical protein